MVLSEIVLRQLHTEAETRGWTIFMEDSWVCATSGGHLIRQRHRHQGLAIIMLAYVLFMDHGWPDLIRAASDRKEHYDTVTAYPNVRSEAIAAIAVGATAIFILLLIIFFT